MPGKIKNAVILKYVTTSILLLAAGASLFACNTYSPVEKSMVAVWTADGKAGDTPVAYGLAVGDGTEILTVINYQDDIPDTLYVGIPGKTRYPASIKALDPHNSVTFLKMDKPVFPPAAVSGQISYVPGTEVVVHGWPADDYQKIQTRRAVFQYSYTGSLLDEGSYIDTPGAAVTTKDGTIIGLLGTSYAFPFHIILGGPGTLYGGMVEIQEVVKIMSPDYAAALQKEKPVYALVWDNDSLAGRKSDLLPAEKYDDLAAALRPLLNTVGTPLDPNTEPVPVYYRKLSYASPGRLDGPMLTVEYAHPVELKNNNGDIIATAKWLGIEWERGGIKTKLLFYGHFEYNNVVVDGGYTFNGDITALLDVLY
jgi:hypothetical protein